jgi:hypothetical protein
VPTAGDPGRSAAPGIVTVLILTVLAFGGFVWIVLANR